MRLPIRCWQPGGVGRIARHRDPNKHRQRKNRQCHKRRNDLAHDGFLCVSLRACSHHSTTVTMGLQDVDTFFDFGDATVDRVMSVKTSLDYAGARPLIQTALTSCVRLPVGSTKQSCQTLDSRPRQLSPRWRLRRRVRIRPEGPIRSLSWSFSRVGEISTVARVVPDL